MGTHNRLMGVLFISFLAIAADTANAKKPADRGDADAGRDLAVVACTGCHVVSADQPFAPLIKDRRTFGKSLTGQTSPWHRCVALSPRCRWCREKGEWRTHTLPTTNWPTWRLIS
jgi:hypothetical protein